jgi:hypothetical protein
MKIMVYYSLEERIHFYVGCTNIFGSCRQMYMNMAEAFLLQHRFFLCHVTHEQVTNLPYGLIQRNLYMHQWI